MVGSIWYLAVAALMSVWYVSIVVCVNINMNGLKVDYYSQTCPESEAIVSTTVAKSVRLDPGAAAALIRLHFHDCFVRGCDASLLLDSTAGNRAEKGSPSKYRSLSGYKIIDEAKSLLELKCPGVVSCADIIAFAARDSAYQAGGLTWKVPAGRRDGRISLASDIPGNLPPPSLDVNQLTQLFAKKYLSQKDMVTLSGAHSIGRCVCSVFSADRLYNFSGRGVQDPTMDPKYASQLKAKCSPSSSSSTQNISVPMDSLTPNQLDEKYYVGLQLKRGLFKSDQTLMSNPTTSKLVRMNSKHPSAWRKKFGRAMIKMGTIDVLTGSQGEIRKNCRIVN